MDTSDPALDVSTNDVLTHPAAPTTAVDESPTNASLRGRTAPTDRRRRTSKWDRPPPPKDWRWWVSGLGKSLIAIGLLMFAFVAYQLWGTAIETARAQRALEDDFEALLAEAAPVPDPVATTPAAADDTDQVPAAAPPTTTPPTTAPEVAEDPVVEAEPSAVEADQAAEAGEAAPPLPVTEQNIPDAEPGDPIARLEIPRIGVDHIVVAGVSPDDLRKGPGHYPDTPLPGQLGNAAIAGHRTTYGQPFYDVDRLEPGDEIVVTTLNGRYVYVVAGQQIVSPSDYQVVATVDPDVANLTLTSCHPRFTARERIVVTSELDPVRSSPIGAAVINYGRDANPDQGQVTGVDEALDDSPGAAPDADAVEAAGADAQGSTADGAGGDAPLTGDGSATAAGAPAAVERATEPSVTNDVSGTAGTADPDDGDDADATGAAGASDPTDGDDAGAAAETADTDTGAAAGTDRGGSADRSGTLAADTGAGVVPPSAASDAEFADAFADGWFSDPGAPLQVAAWGLVVALIGVGAYLTSRATRRDWVGALVGIVPFVVALYFFFQNVNRLLPPNL